jgi:tetratricopeptide (TPR) repeat protein
MAAGAASLFGLRPGEQAPSVGDPTGDSLLGAHRGLFAQYRRIGQLSPPGALLPALSEQTHALHALSERTGPHTGRALLALAARFAEFAGWMAQEAGDDAAALRWTGHAVDLAHISGDDVLPSYALVRRALIAYYRGDSAETIALVEDALSDRLPPRVRGLAWQRKAQGHALGGEYDACMRALDRARSLFARARAEEDDTDAAPVLGTAHLADPVSMITGWCLLDLGRPGQAADTLDRECAHIGSTALRTRARYGIRRALAHAMAGDLDHACALTGELLATGAPPGSATIAKDLRRLARVLGRYRERPAYRAARLNCPTTARFRPVRPRGPYLRVFRRSRQKESPCHAHDLHQLSHRRR